ncbi:MAG: exosortase/archaeosortase family protein [Cephaloticoccus sp.]|nr:exosortase/archaeosortase family protein [Cephaloticoccus sp.]MCF7759327.1 exosortase/archaeosortase family protein [Cephaloticoccus sp.]
MKAFWQKLTQAVPSAFLAALLLGAAFCLFVTWDQSHWWSKKEDYSFGWLVPLFVIYVVHERWPAIKAGLVSCAAAGSPRAGGLHLWAYRLGVTGFLLFGALFFLLGAFYRAGAGPSYPGTLAITMGTVGLLFGLLLTNAPESPSPVKSSLPGDARVQLVALFIFPVMIWFVSAPMVSVIENQLSLFLLHKVVSVVSFVFDMLGMPVEQEGNVLVLPTGRVGVAEACSGIRSLTACLFAGSFLAAVFLDRLWKKITLVALSMLFAFFTNLIRSLFLTAYAYNYGPEAIEGTVHDAAGYAVLGLTVIGLLCLLPLFSLKLATDSDLYPDTESSES